MTTIDPERITNAQQKTQTKIPSTRGAVLRADLKTLENQIAKLAEATPKAALEVLSLFDKVTATVDELQEGGMILTSEIGQIDTLAAQFKKKRALFIRKVGGAQVLVEARIVRQPSPNRWWWYVDQSLAAEKKRKTINLIRNLGIAVFVFTIAALIYQRYLAPDPAIQASYSLQLRAENAIIEGDFEAALQNVQGALLNTPENPELYVLQGVILKNLGENRGAQASIDLALGNYETEDLFYNARARVYLMMGDFQSALADTEVAIKINPKSAISYLHKAQVYESQGDISKAIESYEQANEIAQTLGDVQLQAIIRVSLSNAYQRISIPSLEPEDDAEPTP